jgi:hypothetical protein
VLIALIGLVGTVVSIVLTALVNGKVKGIRQQVENDHGTDPTKTTNLREDMDEKHDTIVTMLRRDVGGIRQDIRLIREDLSATNGRVHELETTQEKRNRS